MIRDSHHYSDFELDLTNLYTKHDPGIKIEPLSNPHYQNISTRISMYRNKKQRSYTYIISAFFNAVKYSARYGWNVYNCRICTGSVVVKWRWPLEAEIAINDIITTNLNALTYVGNLIGRNSNIKRIRIRVRSKW